MDHCPGGDFVDSGSDRRQLFALVRSTIGDFVVVELSRALDRDRDELGRNSTRGVARTLLARSLAEEVRGRRRCHDGDPVPSERASRQDERAQTEELDFVAFDALGSLYMGAKEANLVPEVRPPASVRAIRGRAGRRRRRTRLGPRPRSKDARLGKNRVLNSRGAALIRRPACDRGSPSADTRPGNAALKWQRHSLDYRRDTISEEFIAHGPRPVLAACG